MALLWQSPTSSAQAISSKYDSQIRLSVKHWWLDYPLWKAWKAQLYQESKLDPNAASPVGARGLAQFMPATWNDITRQIGLGGADRGDVAAASDAGAYYMAQLRHIWSSPRSALDRQHLAEASYNAGAGSLLKAQRECGGVPGYEAIVACLPAITGPQFSHETLTYVLRIDRWWQVLETE